MGVGPEDHPLLLAVQGEAVVEELRALLAPVAAPVTAAGGAEAIEAGKDVKGVGSGHDALLGCVDRSWIQTGTHGKTHRGLNREAGRDQTASALSSELLFTRASTSWSLQRPGPCI